MNNKISNIIIPIIVIVCWIAALTLHIVAWALGKQPMWFNMFANDVGLIVLTIIILYDNISMRR